MNLLWRRRFQLYSTANQWTKWFQLVSGNHMTIWLKQNICNFPTNIWIYYIKSLPPLHVTFVISCLVHDFIITPYPWCIALYCVSNVDLGSCFENTAIDFIAKS
jgi:hypothetical protein